MRNIRLILEYDGSRYQGWARLGKNESNNSISNKIIEVLEKMTGERDVELFCGCRTEVGVHAYAQVVNFKTECSQKCIDIKHYLNRYLPMDIAVTDVREMPERFHAQLNAKEKTYTYRMTVSEVPSVFERKYTYHCFKTPDVSVMQQAAQLLIGKHDFKNFSTAKKSKSTIRNVSDIEIYGDLEGETQETDVNHPPQMPKRLPPLIKLLVSRTPKIYQPAVAHAVFPALGAHLWKTYFRYIDNVEHEATLMCCLMAGTGAGKNCISDPINHILKDIRQRDRENLQREKEWKKEMQTKGANKDKRQRPEGLVIQEIDPDTTNAAFVQRLADTEERFLYSRMNEIDQFDALKTSARSKAHFQIMCLAFDPGNVYGQTRIGTGSVSERVCIRFNWNASTTIHKGQAYFRSVLTDGPISRINFCTIPEQPIGADMPIYGTYDASFDEELRPYIERLNKARGLVECRGAHLLAKKLREENADFARLSQSRVYENLSFRANVIAYLKAMVLFVAHGGVWDKTMEEFIRWSLKYDMWCKMKFFGEAIEEVENFGMREKKRGPQNLLDLLPDIFTRDEAGQMRKRYGIISGSLSSMLSTWKNRNYIEIYGEEKSKNECGSQQYIKTARYKGRG